MAGTNHSIKISFVPIVWRIFIVCCREFEVERRIAINLIRWHWSSVDHNCGFPLTSSKTNSHFTRISTSNLRWYGSSSWVRSLRRLLWLSPRFNFFDIIRKESSKWIFAVIVVHISIGITISQPLVQGISNQVFIFLRTWTIVVDEVLNQKSGQSQWSLVFALICPKVGRIYN